MSFLPSAKNKTERLKKETFIFPVLSEAFLHLLKTKHDLGKCFQCLVLLSTFWGDIDQDKLDKDKKLNSVCGPCGDHLGRRGVIKFIAAVVLEGPAPGLRLFQLDAKSVLKPTVPDFPTSKRQWEAQMGKDVVFVSYLGIILEGWGAQHSTFLLCAFWVRIRKELGRDVWAELPSSSHC